MKKENKAAQQSKKDEYKFFSHVKCEYFPVTRQMSRKILTVFFVIAPCMFWEMHVEGIFHIQKRDIRTVRSACFPTKGKITTILFQNIKILPMR